MGVSLVPAKVEVVTKWTRLTTITEVQSFLSLAGYYRRFVQDFAKIDASLTQLTRNVVLFVWTKKCETSFHDLKDKLVTPPVLTMLDDTKLCHLQ